MTDYMSTYYLYLSINSLSQVLTLQLIFNYVNVRFLRKIIIILGQKL
jgi:hypothetical protein